MSKNTEDYNVTIKKLNERTPLDHDETFFSDIAPFYGENNKKTFIRSSLYDFSTYEEATNDGVFGCVSLNGIEYLSRNFNTKYYGKNTPKNESIALLKILVEGGTSSEDATKSSPFLFFDIDVKNEGKLRQENIDLYDNPSLNNEVFEFMKSISVLTFRSSSGIGMAGILYVPALSGKFIIDNRTEHLKIGKAVNDYINKELNIPCQIKFDEAQNKLRQIRLIPAQKNNIKLNPNYLEFHVGKIVPLEPDVIEEDEFTKNSPLVNKASLGQGKNIKVKGSNNNSVIEDFNKNNLCTDLLVGHYELVNSNPKTSRYNRINGDSNAMVVYHESNTFFDHTLKIEGSSPFDLLKNFQFDRDAKAAYKYILELSNEINQTKEVNIAKEEVKISKLNNFKFWDVIQNKDGGIASYKINEFKLLKYLKNQNIFCLINNGSFKYHYVCGQIINDLDLYQIKALIIDYLEKTQGDNEMLINVFLKNKQIYTDLFLSELKIDNLKKQRDTASRVYKYFKNGVLIICANEESKFIDYIDLEHPIHASQILPHYYNENCKTISDYKIFVQDIAQDNFNSFCSAIGYSCSDYKSQANARAIVFNDKSSSFQEANGGRGKSLVAKGISEYTNLARIDGKQLKSDDSFMLSSVKETDKVLFIDDLKQGFHLTSFYNIITDDFSITRKYANTEVIPFEYSPKIILCSNYPVKGSDQSSRRRRFDLVFSNYYSTSNTPLTKFKRQFFTDWGENDWSSFFNFMKDCVQLFLDKGLIPMSDETMKIKDFIGDTSEDFLFYVTDYKDSLMDKQFSLDIIKNEYYQHSNQNISNRKLKNWIKKWCDLNNYKLEECRVDNRRLYKISKHVFLLENFNNQDVA